MMLVIDMQDPADCHQSDCKARWPATVHCCLPGSSRFVHPRPASRKPFEQHLYRNCCINHEPFPTNLPQSHPQVQLVTVLMCIAAGSGATSISAAASSAWAHAADLYHTFARQCSIHFAACQASSSSCTSRAAAGSSAGCHTARHICSAAERAGIATAHAVCGSASSAAAAQCCGCSCAHRTDRCTPIFCNGWPVLMQHVWVPLVTEPSTSGVSSQPLWACCRENLLAACACAVLCRLRLSYEQACCIIWASTSPTLADFGGTLLSHSRLATPAVCMIA